MRIVENKEELEKEAKTTETKKEHNKEKRPNIYYSDVWSETG